MVVNSGSSGVPACSASAQGGDRARSQRGDAVFAALAVAGDVGAGAEADIPAGQGGELGGPQPGLGCEQDPGVVAAAGAGGPVWGGEQGLGLGAGEERDDCLIGPLGQDGQYPGDVGGVLGVAQGCVAEQEGSRPAGRCSCGWCCLARARFGRGTR
jgi:hypothetical protein